MARNTGNQYGSRKADLLVRLELARLELRTGRIAAARWSLRQFWAEWAAAPASSRRRWRCGR
jgi:hypothetical protein